MHTQRCIKVELLKYFNLDYAVVLGAGEKEPIFIYERETVLSEFIFPMRLKEE